MAIFNEGDRVKFTGEIDGQGLHGFAYYNGCTGTILGVTLNQAVGRDANTKSADIVYYVRWDDAMSNCHACDGLCEKEHGWCCFGSDLKYVETTEKQLSRYDIAKMNAG